MRAAAILIAWLGGWLALPAVARPTAAQADAAIRAFVAENRIPAAHVTLFRGDTVILERGYGATGTPGPPPDARSIFPIGSISKQFTAAVVMALADAGKLRLDAQVGAYLPEWFAGEPSLRVSHLLAQTSGLADFLWLEGYRRLADNAATPIEAYIALAAAEPRRFVPGTRWAYSNTNYKALALIAERAGGRSFDRLLADLVLRPAGIDGIASCHELRADRMVPGVTSAGKPAPLDASAAAYVGDGGLCADAASLTKWVRRVLASTDERFSRLARPTLLADGTRVPYGFGLSTRDFLGRTVVWHGGNVDGHSTMIAYLPKEGIGIVILTAKGFVWLTELMPALIDAKLPARAGAAAAPPSGNFEDGLFRYVLTPAAEKLRVNIDLIGPLDFVPVGRHEYVAEEFPATFRLRLPADGTNDRFELDWSELRSYARRTMN
ncbi:MAG TPA: serine hydrolase domain-containing protein [Burkholderiaceae bacterium]|nr:serine hydrolase domain-containing protein [Burkholderiaceae bacterium]